MDGDEIRWRVNTPAGRRRPVAEHQFIQLVLAEIFRQRPSELRRLCQFQVFVKVLWTIEQLRAIWCCASPNADSRRTSRILRIDNPSSDKSDSPCFKQNQTSLLLSSAARWLFRSDRDHPFRAHRDQPFRTRTIS